MLRILMFLSLVPMVGHAAQTCVYDDRRGTNDFTLQVRFPASHDKTEIVMERGGKETVFTMLFTDYRTTVAETQVGFEIDRIPSEFLVLSQDTATGDYTVRLGQKMSPLPAMGKYVEYPVTCTL